MTESAPPSDAIQALIAATEYGSRLDALARVLNEYQPAVLREESSLPKAIVAFGRDGSTATPEQRVRAIFLLMELYKLGKETKKLAHAQLRLLLEDAPADLATVENSKRQAQLCALIVAQRRDWVTDYVATNALEPRLPEKVRLALLTGLFQKSSTWEEAFTKLSSAAGASSMPISNHAALPPAIMAGARAALSKSPAPPGNGLLGSIKALVSTLSASLVSDRANPMRGKFASEMVLLMDFLSARRPSLLALPGVIDLLLGSRALAPKGKISGAAMLAWENVVARLADGILILAGKGIPPFEQFALLERMTGSREAALRHTKPYAAAIAKNQAIATLLTEGYLPEQPNTALGNSDDTALATVLLRAVELLVALDKPGATADYAKALAVEAESLAKRRRLVVDGERGQVVPYSPLKHRLSKSADAPPESVRILVPGVLRAEGEIVLQAVVEQIDGKASA